MVEVGEGGGGRKCKFFFVVVGEFGNGKKWKWGVLVVQLKRGNKCMVGDEW